MYREAPGLHGQDHCESVESGGPGSDEVPACPSHSALVDRVPTHADSGLSSTTSPSFRLLNALGTAASPSGCCMLLSVRLQDLALPNSSPLAVSPSGHWFLLGGGYAGPLQCLPNQVPPQGPSKIKLSPKSCWVCANYNMNA